MSTGLLASTVTPGRTAPEVSFTVPEMLAALVPCAPAAPGKSITQVRKPTPTHTIRLIPASFARRPRGLGTLIHPWRRARRDLLTGSRSEEHTSELQSRVGLVCRLLL